MLVVSFLDVLTQKGGPFGCFFGSISKIFDAPGAFFGSDSPFVTGNGRGIRTPRSGFFGRFLDVFFWFYLPEN